MRQVVRLFSWIFLFYTPFTSELSGQEIQGLRVGYLSPNAKTGEIASPLSVHLLASNGYHEKPDSLRPETYSCELAERNARFVAQVDPGILIFECGDVDPGMLHTVPEEVDPEMIFPKPGEGKYRNNGKWQKRQFRWLPYDSSGSPYVFPRKKYWDHRLP